MILDATAQGFIAVTDTIADDGTRAARAPMPDRLSCSAGSPA